MFLQGNIQELPKKHLKKVEGKDFLLYQRKLLPVSVEVIDNQTYYLLEFRDFKVYVRLI